MKLALVGTLLVSSLLLVDTGRAIGTASSAEANQIRRPYQLDVWRSPDDKVSSPLTEIVEITGFLENGRIKHPGMTGTAWFTDECRLMSALHVPLSMKHGQRRNWLDKNESLVGEWIAFETAPIASLEWKTQSGRFIILAHGNLGGSHRLGNAKTDIVVGYDPECTSDEFKLGHIRVRRGTQLRDLIGDEFFVAGHSKVAEARRPDGSYRLFIDPACRVLDSPHGSDNYLVTNCAGDGGGSGAPLLRAVSGTFRGISLRDKKTGNAVLIAYGVYQTGGEEPGTNGFGSFYDLDDSIAAALSGPVDVAALEAARRSRRR